MSSFFTNNKKKSSHVKVPKVLNLAVSSSNCQCHLNLKLLFITINKIINVLNKTQAKEFCFDQSKRTKRVYPQEQSSSEAA